MGSQLRLIRIVAGLMALLLYPASAGEDPQVLFQRFRSRMSEHLAHLPNYTCRETIQRYIRTGTQLQHVDQVQLDVAFSGRREMFSPPGAGRFTEEPIEKLVSEGTIGSAAMGSHVDLLLSHQDTEFKFSGEGKKDGHKTFRLDLVVPLEESHFLVRHSGVVGIAGYQVSLWVDAATFDPVEVHFKVNRIPRALGVSLIEEFLHYKQLTIGNSEFSLPQRSELAATDSNGTYSLNLATLEGCHEYTADSVVTYDPSSQGAASRDRQDHQ